METPFFHKLFSVHLLNLFLHISKQNWTLTITPGGGGYSHIWPIRVCAAQQGMFFASLNRPFSLEQGIFYFRFDSGIVSNFP